MPNKKITLKKVLPAVLGPDIAAKYLEPVESEPAEIYEKALNYLLSGNTEKTINFIINGLELDKNNLQILYLCKSMLLSITEYLYDASLEQYLHKYPDLYKAKIEMESSLLRLKRSGTGATDKLREMEHLNDLEPFSLTKFFKKKGIFKKIANMEQNLDNFEQDISKMETSITHVDSLGKADEYAKVLRLVVEVCTLPSSFEWVLKDK